MIIYLEILFLFSNSIPFSFKDLEDVQFSGSIPLSLGIYFLS